MAISKNYLRLMIGMVSSDSASKIVQSVHESYLNEVKCVKIWKNPFELVHCDTRYVHKRQMF